MRRDIQTADPLEFIGLVLLGVQEFYLIRVGIVGDGFCQNLCRRVGLFVKLFRALCDLGLWFWFWGRLFYRFSVELCHRFGMLFQLWLWVWLAVKLCHGLGFSFNVSFGLGVWQRL